MAARTKKRRPRIKINAPTSPAKRALINISPKLQWVERYLKRLRRKMPSLMMPARIRSYLPPLNKEMRVYATCAVETRVITMATHRVITKQVGKRRKRAHVTIPKRTLMMTLAHEIAHLRYELHDYEQESFARTIFQAFGFKDKCPHCGGTGQIAARYMN